MSYVAYQGDTNPTGPAFSAESDFTLDASGGAELFVLEGSIQETVDTLVKHSWLRSSLNSKLKLKAGKNGAKVWIKTGHLSQVAEQIERVNNA